MKLIDFLEFCANRPHPWRDRFVALLFATVVCAVVVPVLYGALDWPLWTGFVGIAISWPINLALLVVLDRAVAWWLGRRR